MAEVKTRKVIHMVRRGGISKTKAWAIRLIAAALSLIVCAFVIVGITGQNPVAVYAGIISGAVGSGRRAWVTIREMVTLLVIAVGLTPAFKMKFWNLGGEGQILIGGAATAAVMIYLGPVLQDWLLFIIILIVSALSGYVAMQIVTFCIVLWENPKGSNHVGVINQKTKAGWFPSFTGQDYMIDVILVTVITVLVFAYLRYTKQGYELQVVGESVNTARYAGIDVKRVIVRTMMISSAICGIAGAIIVGGASHTISTATAGGRGFVQSVRDGAGFLISDVHAGRLDPDCFAVRTK